MTNSQFDSQNMGSEGSTSQSKVNGNHRNATALMQWKPEARRIPEGGPSPRSPKSVQESFEKPSTTDLTALWAALRRRWFLASFLGFTFACIAAGTTWMLMPTKYIAFSELYISSRLDNIIWEESESEKAFITYKQTSMKKVLSPDVIVAVLRRPDINSLSILAEQENPSKWIEEEMRVESAATEFIRISLASTNNREATALVNAMTEEFIEEVVENERTEKLTTKSFLEKVERDNEDKLRTRRNQLQKLTEALKTSAPETAFDRQRMQLQLLSDTMREHTRVKFDLMRHQAQLASRESKTENGEELDIPEAVIEYRVSENAEIQQLEARKKALEKLIEKTEGAVKADSPVLLQQRRDLETITAELKAAQDAYRPVVIEAIKADKQLMSKASNESLKTAIEFLTKQEKILAEDIKTQEANTSSYGIETYQLESIKQQIAQQEDVAKKIAEELQRLDIKLTQPSRISTHRKAEVPSEPEMRQKYMMTAFAGFGVLSLIVGGIVWLESAARRISTAKEITSGLQMPIMGSLPLMPNWLVQGRTPRRNGRSAVWQSVWTESIDSARTMMLRDAAVESRQIVMVASAMSGEGKTTLSSHLATSLARAGRKTLLVDCDLRRPSIHKLFEMSFKPGICEVMRGEAALEDAIQLSPQENLYVLPSGHITQAVLTMLAQGDIADVFEPLRSHFDFIIVDSSPILPVTDSLLVGQQVDAVIFAIRRDVSRYGKVASAYQRLSMLGVPVLGAVVIGLDEASYGSMYGSGYGYGYARSYHYYHTPPEDVVDAAEDSPTAETVDS
ncbi:MAG: polysaccharide biosynthesis tyrosine autokinase [Planctomycetaceae bacterium]